MESLKREILELLEKDLEFRYAVAGYLGLLEVLKRLDSLAEEQVKLREEQVKIWGEIEKLREEQAELRKEQTRLREGQTKIWAEIVKIWEEVKALREEQVKLREEQMKLREEHVKLREDMVEGFKRHDEEIARLRADMVEGFKRHDEEIARLRADMVEGFNLLRRHVDALGARWGIISEQAFREGLKGLVEREFGVRVEKWVRYDGEGYVFGRPSNIDIDLAVHDEKVLLVEVKSHVSSEDVYVFKRKAEFYEKIEMRKPSRLLIVTPYIDEDALEVALQLKIETYTKV